MFQNKQTTRFHLLLLGICFLGLGVGVLADDKPTEFIRGVKALDHKDWEEGDRLMLAAQKRSDLYGKRIRIYGYRYAWYLPHYYRGVALYKMQRCEEALAEWQAAEDQAHIKKKGRERVYGLLADYRSECREVMRSQQDEEKGL